MTGGWVVAPQPTGVWFPGVAPDVQRVPLQPVSGLTYQLVDGLGRDSANLTWQPRVLVGGQVLEESAVYPTGDVVATLADVVSWPADPALECYEYGRWWPLSLTPRTNHAILPNDAPFGATVSAPYQTTGPDGMAVWAVTLTLPTAEADSYPMGRAWVDGAPWTPGQTARIYARRVSGGSLVRLLAGGTAGGGPSDIRTLSAEWTLLEKITASTHYYWGLGLLPGDPGIVVELCLPSWGEGRIIPTLYVPVTVVDATYSQATGAVSLAQAAAQVRSINGPCTGSGPSWQVPSTSAPSVEGILAPSAYTYLHGKLTITPTLKAGAPVSVGGVAASGGPQTWTVPCPAWRSADLVAGTVTLDRTPSGAVTWEP